MSPIKKQWASPELVLISISTVHGGAHNGTHEGLISKSSKASTFSYNMHHITGAVTARVHNRAYYVS